MEVNMVHTDDTFAEQAVGALPPRSFLLDASILDDLEEHKVAREEIKHSNIEYIFPSGFNQLDLFEECRALALLEDFDAMYDITMQMLENRGVIINIKNKDGSKTQLCSFHVVDRFQNLRGVEAIDDFPVLLTWLVEFAGAHLLKKYPLPGISQPQSQAATLEQSGTKTPSTRATREEAQETR
jgi:hypothetical protein